MTVQERFAEDHAIPLEHVRKLTSLALKIGRCNEHIANGDPHPENPAPTDKNANAELWGYSFDGMLAELRRLVEPYGFTEVVCAGLGPTLKKGERWVEIPY